LNKFARGKQL